MIEYEVEVEAEGLYAAAAGVVIGSLLYLYLSDVEIGLVVHRDDDDRGVRRRAGSD